MQGSLFVFELQMVMVGYDARAWFLGILHSRTQKVLIKQAHKRCGPEKTSTR